MTLEWPQIDKRLTWIDTGLVGYWQRIGMDWHGLVELADWRVEFELKIDLQLAQDRHELACIDKDEQIGRERERGLRLEVW